VPISTLQGDLIGIPLDVLDDSEEKSKTNEDQEDGERAPQPVDSNRICFFSSAWESTIHAAELGDLVLPGEDVRGLFELPREEGGVWWLNVNNPSKDEVGAICKAFGTHPLTTEDIATQESREKIELFPSYYFACFRSFNTVVDSDGNEEYEPFNIYAIVFREGTLSFSFAPNGHASNVRKRIALLKDFVALSSDWICYALM
jgi:magnesium transporter